MQEAYSLAPANIMYALQDGGNCLDCGANKGQKYELLRQAMGLEQRLYRRTWRLWCQNPESI